MKYYLLFLLLIANVVHAKTWLVGPTRQYTVPSAVASLVADGDTVLIDSGLYMGDVSVWSKNNLVLRCPKGLARLDANGKIADDKGIWVVYGRNTYVEGFEFYGAQISFADGNNGAGIRVQGDGFNCRRCYFHSNQEGILTGNDTANNNILIESCVFDSNGVEGTESGGWQHNIYIGGSSSCTITYCYFHHSMVGHEIKCRANRSYILYNKIVDGPAGDGSLSIDIPQGGLAFVMGNTIEKGPMTENSTVIGYGEEGFKNPDTDFYFINNTIVTDRNPTTFFEIAAGTKIALIANNIIAGIGHPITGFTDTESNVIEADTSFFHFADPANCDYHITAPFPGFTSAASLGSVDGFSLSPTGEYIDLADSAPRPAGNEVGAFTLAPSVVSWRDQSDGIDRPSYPNPFERRVHIPVPESSISTEIRLYNVSGILVRHEIVEPSDGTIILNRGSLGAGVYFYKLALGSGMGTIGGTLIAGPLP